MLSIIVPVYNEQDSLSELVERIDEVAQRENLELEIVMIDDGSRDQSWQVIEDLAGRYQIVHGFRFRRNFGKAAALAAGFENSSGDILITMDADLQDDPNEIPNLLAKLDEGLDVVSGWKKVRHDPWHKVLPSRVFNGMISWLTGVKLHDHNCGLKAYRREAVAEVNLYGEMHRFVPVLADARGFKVGEIVIQHHARQHGVSKYGFERFVKGFLDLLTVYFLTGYGRRPQHLIGSIGLGSFVCGMAGLFVLSVMWVITRLTPLDDLNLHERALFYFCIVGVLLGIQLLTMGFLAELITAQNRPNDKPYSISETTPTPQS
ncbi:MAG TPA: glycosyltransferase [Planctomycetaceae bacterium]|nr:glycosyltransferase [Planctomycetaceae bacterium]